MEKDNLTNEDLAIMIKNNQNTTESMNLLWQNTEKLVRTISRKYSTFVPEDELLQEGFLAIVDAANHFDQSKENSFATYAAYWIKQRMIKCISDSFVIHIPAQKYALVRKYREISEKTELNTGSKAKIDDFKQFLGLDDENIAEIAKNASMVSISSLYAPLNGEENSGTIADLIPDEEIVDENVCKILDTEELSKELWDLVEKLPEEQKNIINAQFIECMTFKEIAEAYKMTENEVKKAKKNAFKQLQSTKNKKIHAYYEAYIQPSSVHHVGVSTFKTTWTSAVERQAIEHLERWGIGTPPARQNDLPAVTAQKSR